MNRYLLSKAGINANEGIHRFNDKQELYERFLKSFPENDHYFVEMEQGIWAGDVEKAFEAAHALKGVAGNLSINQLYEDLVPLVEQLRKGEIGDARELLDHVKESYAKVLEAIKIVFAE